MRSELDQLTEQVLDASRALVAIATQSLTDSAADLTLVQYRCLVVLAMEGATGTTDLATDVGVHQSTVTRATDQLVRKGFAVKSRDEADRRRTLVTVSDGGKDIVDAVMQARRSIIRKVLDSMALRDVTSTGLALAAFTRATESETGQHIRMRHTV